MPPSTRRQALTRVSPRRVPGNVGVVDLEETTDELPELEDAGDDNDMDSIGDHDLEDDGEDADPEDEPFPPPGLKEISSLASWTVSTAKPGNGVAALRSPDVKQFWQSDGPQPHLLSIHFFKLVSIVHMRIFLDFQNDESYTPTKIQFLAGMGVHDLQEFAEMSFEQPTGWIDVDFSNVGPIPETEDEGPDGLRNIDWSKRPVLKAFLIQVRILENHQNGKDTHLRAVQLFARDEAQPAILATDVLEKTPRIRKLPLMLKKVPQRTKANSLGLAPWMLEPDLR